MTLLPSNPLFMVLIPPTDANPAPQTSTPVPGSPAVPPQPSPEADHLQRKLAVAQGKGFVREAPPTVYQETGEEITLRDAKGMPLPCKYCGANPCSGPNWVFEGVSIFKCNSCGKKQKMGVTQELADKNKAEIEALNNVDSLRRRAWRDDDARREEERLRNLNELALNPNRPPLDPRFVSKAFFE